MSKKVWIQQNAMHVTCEHSNLQISNIANIVENTYITKCKNLTTVKDTHRPMRFFRTFHLFRTVIFSKNKSSYSGFKVKFAGICRSAHFAETRTFQIIAILKIWLNKQWNISLLLVLPINI